MSPQCLQHPLDYWRCKWALEKPLENQKSIHSVSAFYDSNTAPLENHHHSNTFTSKGHMTPWLWSKHPLTHTSVIGINCFNIPHVQSDRGKRIVRKMYRILQVCTFQSREYWGHFCQYPVAWPSAYGVPGMLISSTLMKKLIIIIMPKYVIIWHLRQFF